MKTVTVTHSLDTDGSTPIVTVPLSNDDKKAVLLQDDFNMLISSGTSPVWRYSQDRIVEKGKARVSIARLIANAKEGEKIIFLDRDPCNLRRDNLVTSHGAGKYKTRDNLTPKNRKYSEEKIELKHIFKEESWMKLIKGSTATVNSSVAAIKE